MSDGKCGALSSPDSNCSFCPRLQQFRNRNRDHFPEWHNAPVHSFGDDDARLLIVGLAPGLKGANRTGRPFTGDFAGEFLYGILGDFGLAQGSYTTEADDDFALIGCRVTNAVRCVPPNPTSAVRVGFDKFSAIGPGGTADFCGF